MFHGKYRKEKDIRFETIIESSSVFPTRILKKWNTLRPWFSSRYTEPEAVATVG